MKSKLLSILILIPFLGFGQLQSGDILIETNYGFVGGKGLWGTIADEAGVPVEFFGPASLRLQYMTSDKFGIGLDLNYSSRSLIGNSGTYTDPVTGSVSSFNYDLTQNVIRAMLRTSWEFVNNDNNYGVVRYNRCSINFTFYDSSNKSRFNRN